MTADRLHEDMPSVDHLHEGMTSVDHLHEGMTSVDHLHEGVTLADHLHKDEATIKCVPSSLAYTYVYCALLLVQVTAEHSLDLMLSTLFDENIQHAWPYGRLVMICTQCCVAHADRAGISTYKDAANSFCNNAFAIEATISSVNCCED
ncbi:TPA: hypothetical protein ACH3X1_012271 [Trebouxia sp. C0004]